MSSAAGVLHIELPEFVVTVPEAEDMARQLERADQRLIEVLASPPYPGRYEDVMIRAYELHRICQAMVEEFRGRRAQPAGAPNR